MGLHHFGRVKEIFFFSFIFALRGFLLFSPFTNNYISVTSFISQRVVQFVLPSFLSMKERKPRKPTCNIFWSLVMNTVMISILFGTWYNFFAQSPVLKKRHDNFLCSVLSTNWKRHQLQLWYQGVKNLIILLMFQNQIPSLHVALSCKPLSGV